MPTDTPHENHRKRMREKYKDNGFTAFKTHEILEMLLFAVYTRSNTNEIAHRLEDRFGGIAGVLSAEQGDLTEVAGVGEGSAWWFGFLRDLYSEITSERFTRFPMNSEDMISAYSIARMGLSPAGSASLSFLDGSGMIRTEKWLNIGKGKKEDRIERELMREEFANGARGMILMHNHRGVPGSPSPDDIAITAELVADAKGIGYENVWHIIVSDDGYTFI